MYATDQILQACERNRDKLSYFLLVVNPKVLIFHRLTQQIGSLRLVPWLDYYSTSVLDSNGLSITWDLSIENTCLILINSQKVSKFLVVPIVSSPMSLQKTPIILYKQELNVKKKLLEKKLEISIILEIYRYLWNHKHKIQKQSQRDTQQSSRSSNEELI